MIASDVRFSREVVDDLVLFSEFDPDLAEKLKWVNTQANQNNVSFYEMISYILHRKDKTVKDL
jgi:hypothetical protein